MMGEIGPMDALVSFAESIYGAPGVEPGLLDLQDRYGLDVCVVLACAWYGAAGGGRLAPEAVDGLEEAVAEWRAEVVQPLRSVRRGLKGEQDQGDAVRRLREDVKACELDAERIELTRLEYELGGFSFTDGDPALRAADTAANLAVCLQAGEVPMEGAAREALTALLRAAFPSIAEDRIQSILATGG